MSIADVIREGAVAAFPFAALIEAVVQLERVEQLAVLGRQLRAAMFTTAETERFGTLVEWLVAARFAALQHDGGKDAHAACEVALRALYAVATEALGRVAR